MFEDLPPTEAMAAMSTAAELGSLSAAAVELGITHGAVSRRVAGIEAWLGQPVFERHGRGVALTTAGELLVRRVDRSLGAISALAGDLRTSLHRGVVRLSVLPSFARLWVMPRFNDLQGSPADVVIALASEHRMAGFDRRDADVAVRSGSGGWAGVDSRPLFPELSYPLAAPEVTASMAKTGSDGLLDQVLIHDSDSAGWRRWLRSAGVPFRPRTGELRFDDYDLALSAAEQGLGVVLARTPLSDGHERSGRLVRLPGDAIEGSTGQHLVLRQGETRSAVLRVAERIVRLAESRPAPLR